ncbi:CBS domain-containing protein, partial [Mycobacterium tuberculosis]|nr:CBS domain-containing protein [Mycobacterium tuberculosis]
GQDIVLKPAAEYISSFLKEVNGGRVIMVDTLSTKGDGSATAGGVTVMTGTILEEAAKTMTDANQQHATVVDEAGKPLGVISMNNLIQ